jgi:hypothetical protein
LVTDVFEELVAFIFREVQGKLHEKMVALYREEVGYALGIASQQKWSGQSHGYNMPEESRVKMRQWEARRKQSKK